MERFNPSRLDLARRRRGLTKGKLAEMAEISPRILTAYERGERAPSEQTLNRLGDALGFPVSFFRGEDIDEITVDGVSFRALSKMTSRQQDQATGAAAIALQLDAWIRERFTLPEPNVPRLPEADPEAASVMVRHAWGLGQHRSPNMVHLLEAHGVRVFSLVQECAEVDAFSFWRDGVPYAFLNSMKTAERSRMDAAHELGHLVMHAHGAPSGRVAEEQAQAFGSAFLMPGRSVLADAPRGATAKQIIRAKRKWNVSAMNLAHRMHKVGLLTEWQVRSAYIQLGQLGYRDGEPDGIERESSQILPKVFGVLRSEGVMRADVARELHLPVDELNRAVFGLVVAREGEAAAPPAPAPTTPRPPQLRIVV